MVYATVWYSKTCITHELKLKCNLRIDWKFENKLILSMNYVIEIAH